MQAQRNTKEKNGKKKIAAALALILVMILSTAMAFAFWSSGIDGATENGRFNLNIGEGNVIYTTIDTFDVGNHYFEMNAGENSTINRVPLRPYCMWAHHGSDSLGAWIGSEESRPYQTIIMSEIRWLPTWNPTNLANNGPYNYEETSQDMLGHRGYISYEVLNVMIGDVNVTDMFIIETYFIDINHPLVASGAAAPGDNAYHWGMISRDWVNGSRASETGNRWTMLETRIRIRMRRPQNREEFLRVQGGNAQINMRFRVTPAAF